MALAYDPEMIPSLKIKIPVFTGIDFLLEDPENLPANVKPVSVIPRRYIKINTEMSDS